MGRGKVAAQARFDPNGREGWRPMTAVHTDDDMTDGANPPGPGGRTAAGIAFGGFTGMKERASGKMSRR